MSEKVEPALTLEEWRQWLTSAAASEHEPLAEMAWGVLFGSRPEGRSLRHAHAATALHGQPFGFTWEDVDALHTTINGYHRRNEDLEERLDEGPWVRNGIILNQGSIEMLEALTDRIAALLPPR